MITYTVEDVHGKTLWNEEHHPPYGDGGVPQANYAVAELAEKATGGHLVVHINGRRYVRTEGEETMNGSRARLRVGQIEKRLQEKHRRAAADPVLASLVNDLKDAISEEAQATFATAVRNEIARVKLENFRDGYEATDEEALGIALARLLEWDGVSLLRTAQHALEDANFHTESGQLGAMADEAERR